jgi:hypothetical protein
MTLVPQTPAEFCAFSCDFFLPVLPPSDSDFTIPSQHARDRLKLHAAAPAAGHPRPWCARAGDGTPGRVSARLPARADVLVNADSVRAHLDDPVWCWPRSAKTARSGRVVTSSDPNGDMPSHRRFASGALISG